MDKTPRKTAKYYRDILNNGDTRAAARVLPEIIRKFGHKRWESSKTNDTINLRGYTSFAWDHRVDGFFLTRKGDACVDIYWQGDSTDGNKSLYVEECANGAVIPAVHEWLGDRTYELHSDIRVSREELEAAFKALAKYLSPAEMRARKERWRRAALESKVFDRIDGKRKDFDRWEMEEFWNGRNAVQRLLEKNPSLLDNTYEVLVPIVDKVFAANLKSDYTLRGGYFSGEKKYDLAY